MCFYDIGLWKFYKTGTLNKLASAYVRCIKIFFSYHKYFSVSCMLMELGLPSFNTVVFNADFISSGRVMSSVNSLIQLAVHV